MVIAPTVFRPRPTQGPPQAHRSQSSVVRAQRTARAAGLPAPPAPPAAPHYGAAETGGSAFIPSRRPPGHEVGEVRYETPFDAELALVQLDGSAIAGHTINLQRHGLSKEGTKLLVYGLPPRLKWQILKEHFETVGVVAFATIHCKPPFPVPGGGGPPPPARPGPAERRPVRGGGMITPPPPARAPVARAREAPRARSRSPRRAAWASPAVQEFLEMPWEDLINQTKATPDHEQWREFCAGLGGKLDPRYYPATHLACFLAGEDPPSMSSMCQDLEYVDKNDLVCRAKLACKAGAPPLNGRGKDPDRYSVEELTQFLQECEGHFAAMEAEGLTGGDALLAEDDEEEPALEEGEEPAPEEGEEPPLEEEEPPLAYDDEEAEEAAPEPEPAPARGVPAHGAKSTTNARPTVFVPKRARVG